MSYYFYLNIKKKLSTIWTERQLINWIPWWSMYGESGFATAQKLAPRLKNFLSTISYSKLYSYSVYRGYKTFSYSNSYKMAIFRVIFGACSKWQPTGDLMFNDASKSPASTPTGLSGYVESTRKIWGGGNIRKISFSSRNYHVPRRLFTWPVPTQTEELPPASSFASYLVPAVFDPGAMHLLIVDSPSLSRSSGGKCLRDDAMHIASLC